jgi:hypothetical protein
MSGNITTALLSIAAGVSTIALAALSSPVEAAAASAALAGIGSSIIGSGAIEGMNEGYSSVANRLKIARERGRLPDNHDMEKAIRRAHLRGLEVRKNVDGDHFDARLAPSGHANQ